MNSRYIDILRRAITLEDEHEHDPDWLGAEWQDLRARGAVLNDMVIDGLLVLSYSSRSTKAYKTADPNAARKLVAQSPHDQDDDDDDQVAVPKDIFDIIVGHDRTKNICKLSLASPRPVHVILVGEPATAKTLFLSELSRLPGARYALGGTSSRAGIVDFLIDQRPRFLIIDEIDKMDGNDQDVLLSLMETGIVTRLKRNMRDSIRLDTWVYAGANSAARISRPLLSRFVQQHLQPYSEADFRAICLAILTKRERVEPVLAGSIIDSITPLTKDPRDAVKVARLVTDASQVQEIVSSIWS